MRIFQSRENLYSQADLRIQVTSENIEEVAMKIINAIHKEIIQLIWFNSYCKPFNDVS